MLGEDKEREKRRKKYKFALVKREEKMDEWKDYPEYAVEYKSVLNRWYTTDYTMICDDQPERVLRGMLKLLQEKQ
jgi:hypothetical protein